MNHARGLKMNVRKWEITYDYLFVTLDDAQRYVEDGDDQVLWEIDQQVTHFDGTKEECFDYIIEILKENVDFKISSVVDITEEMET